MEGTLMLHERNLYNAHLFSDPECVLYRAFGLRRGKLAQLFSPRIIRNGIWAILAGHRLGKLNGDGFRMPGVFILVDGSVVTEHPARSADDDVDYDLLLAKLTRRAGKARMRSDRRLSKLAVH